MSLARAAYPSAVSDEEWVLVAPYLALLREDLGQRDHDLREVCNGLRFIVKTGAPWRFMPHDLPPWAAVYQQTQRWLSAQSFADVAGDLRAVLRMAGERKPEPSAMILDSRTLRSSPESGARAGYDGAKRKQGSKLHLAVDTPGHPVALSVTPADVDDRAEVDRLTGAVQAETDGSVEKAAEVDRLTGAVQAETDGSVEKAAEVDRLTGAVQAETDGSVEKAAEVDRLTGAVQAETDGSVEKAFVDQGYNGPNAAAAACRHGIELEVVKAPEAKRGFVLLPRRWVVERSFAWATRCRRLVKDYERYGTTLAGYHLVAFVCLMLRQAERLMAGA